MASEHDQHPFSDHRSSWKLLNAECVCALGGEVSESSLGLTYKCKEDSLIRRNLSAVTDAIKCESQVAQDSPGDKGQS